MTAPLAQQTVTVKDPAAVRKRRRRAPTGGAADDCFTCSKRNVKCDRRRPYCSQCLEIGNECSGYKTQLTWGVGVASRGKLRGLSLPIARAPPVTREPKKSPIGRTRANSSTAIITTTWADVQESRANVRAPIDIPATSHSHSHAHAHAHSHSHSHSHSHLSHFSHATSAPTTPAYPIPGYDYLSMSHNDNTPPMHQGSWSSVGFSHGMVHSPDTTPKYTKFPLHLITEGLSSSVDSVGSEVDYLSPLSQSYQRDDMPFNHSPTVLYDGYPTQQSSPIAQSPPQSLLLDHSRAPTSCPGLVYAPSEHSSSLHSHLDSFEPHLSHKLMRECDSLNVTAADTYNTHCNSSGPIWSPTHATEEEIQSPQSEYNPTQWPVLRDPRSLRVNQDLLSKMPFFMDYYKITMAPSMVYIDGPHNPFRENIMRLAVNSHSLQHAICALSACNLRMKRKLSLGHDTRELSDKLMAEKQAAESMGDNNIEDQSLSEEFQHRNLAVHLLNQQLNDPVKSCHDSVLATILLLCHYRMVESGVAKFHTQFAGVRKILAMRKSQQFAPSHDSAWMETLFTYFDAISASINDREAQLAPGFEGVSPDIQALPPGAENMVGCERELFKTIGKLGRLNLLSQHRPVQSMLSPSQMHDDVSQSHASMARSMGHSYKGSVGSIGSVSRQQLYSPSTPRFDGNGFGSTLDDDDMLTSAISSSATFDDHRLLFWSEWKEARQELQNWQFDSVSVASSLPGSPSPSQVRDLEYLSEAFRYAALLYTERLAGPNMPSSHTNFQNLVSQVVYYATSLETGSTAEKFLLWPLFVAGSECVNELQQKIIRTKCRDIMSRSGYMNNLAALDVLEKLWSGDFKSGTDLRRHSQCAKMGNGRGPFNWAKCLGGPGAGVEWIMF